jgi:hypothetical protein
MGVPREGATEGALKLQNAGLIYYTGGRIRVRNREGLEKRTCECYAVVRKEYDRLLPSKLAAYDRGTSHPIDWSFLQIGHNFVGGSRPSRPDASHSIVKKGYDRILPNRNRSKGLDRRLLWGTELSHPGKLKVPTLTDTTSSIPATIQSCDNLEEPALVGRATFRG